jgi:hypothetical protein
MTNTSPNTSPNLMPKDIQKMVAADLIELYKGRKVIFTYNNKTTRGEVIGGILNPMDHIYIFKALHVITEAGEKVTIHANTATFLKE